LTTDDSKYIDLEINVMKEPIKIADVDPSDFEGLDIFMTGGTSGIGKKAALAFGSCGANILINGRSDNGKEVADKINEQTDGQSTFVRGDLSDINEIRAVCSEVKEETDNLDILINNAGVYFRNDEQSMDLEYTYVVNNLSHFYITLELMDLLKNSEGRSLIVNTASEAHRGTKNINIEELKNSSNNWESYCRSKTFNIMFTDCLRRRLSDTEVGCTSIHPGVIPGSGFVRNLPSPLRKISNVFEYIPLPVVDTTKDGAAMILFASSSLSYEEKSLYYVEFEDNEPSGVALNKDRQEEFWRFTSDQVNLEPEEYL